MFPQRDAIIRLLRDDDPETVSLIKKQLSEGGPQIIPDLRDLLQIDDQRVTAHVSEIIHALIGEKSIQDFTAFCRTFSENGDLEQACWLLARAMQPGLNCEPYRIKLDAWGRQFSHLIPQAVSDRERVFHLGQFMSQQLGFRGNTDDYYHPRNSLLPSVIDTRSGIPITITLLHILVARRAGMIVEGVNLPGHFIARHGDVLFDPFHRGKIITIADCAEILARQNLTIEAVHLAEADNHAILVRILANLLFIYEHNEEFDLYQRVMNWLSALDRTSGSAFDDGTPS